MDTKNIKNENKHRDKIIYSVDISESKLDEFLALAKKKKTSGSKILEQLIQDWMDEKKAE